MKGMIKRIFKIIIFFILVFPCFLITLVESIVWYVRTGRLEDKGNSALIRLGEFMEK